jgi:SAM-dependent methyltransferase
MANEKSVSAHLNIALQDYDSRIRTFVPGYEEMLDEAEDLASLFLGQRPTILDLGIGTGAFSERCLRLRPEAAIIGIDSDPEMLKVARVRLHFATELDLRFGSFLEMELPEVDLIAGTISLHHVPDPETKKALYDRCRESLRDGGVMLVADCFPARNEALAERGWAVWRRHLERFYTPEETTAYFEAWSGEDTHFPLEDELEWLRGAGFQAEVTWRRDPFAVVLCK